MTRKGFQRTGIGISDGGMLSQSAELAQGGGADLQQAAYFTRSVHRGRVDPGLVEELPELGFGQVQNLGVTLDPRNASKTAGERLYATHGITPLSILPEGSNAPRNALVRESRRRAALSLPKRASRPRRRRPSAPPDAPCREQPQHIHSAQRGRSYGHCGGCYCCCVVTL